jgi:hypothetical protein
VADKEAMDRRATEEAMVKRATEEAMVKRATEEATVKAAVDKEVTGKTADEAEGAVGDSPPPPSAMRLKWSGPRGQQLQAAPPRQPNVPTGVFENLGMSNSPFFFFFFSVGLHSLITSPFCSAPLPLA